MLGRLGRATAALGIVALVTACSGGGADSSASGGRVKNSGRGTTSTAPDATAGAGATTTAATVAAGAPTPAKSSATTAKGAKPTTAAPGAASAPTGGDGALTEVNGFGSNPGNVRMFEYTPRGLRGPRPVIVVLHGCTQTAGGFDDESGWTALAERLQLVLVFPQQRQANNGSVCWNFFLPKGNARGEGEPASIKQMVDWAVAHRGGDVGRVYVTGLSAGAAMTNVMMATYPDVFKAGAPIAGVAFKCAVNEVETVGCNQGTADRTPQEWGSLVRSASPWKGPWPRVSVWHGTSDGTVNAKAMPEIVEQWTDVHGTDQTADVNSSVRTHPHAVYKNKAGAAVVETFAIQGMGHGQPIDPSGSPTCGRDAPYFLDVGVCAASHVATWFGLG